MGGCSKAWKRGGEPAWGRSVGGQVSTDQAYSPNGTKDVTPAGRGRCSAGSKRVFMRRLSILVMGLSIFVQDLGTFAEPGSGQRGLT